MTSKEHVVSDHGGTLKDWESCLAPQVRQVELLGEISITADECAQLGKVIGLRLRTLGHRHGLRTLRQDYPCALAVYLVAQGIYGYQGGDYWSEVVQVTGLSGGNTWQVGQAFEEVLEELGLPLFYDMRAEKAQRYVSLILAHGGIPNYCLPDFFRNMLQPSVVRASYADMSAAELIEEWKWRSSVQYFTDKPVLRFLAYGGRVAQDFVERCREMAWAYLDAGLLPDAEDVGLPKRVVDVYSQWIAEQGAEQVQRDTTEQWRLRKPEVLVDPWGEGLILDLPPQQVPATMIYADIVWQVTAGEEIYPPVPVRVRRAGFDLRTEANALSLSQPAATYQVSLLADGQVKRAWRYQGVDERHPLLVFDPERGTLLSWGHSLPARCLGLLYPARAELQVEGEARLLEELPRLPWGWAGFCGGTWDLSRATCLTLLRDGETVLRVTLRPDESAQRPHLVGGQPLISGLPDAQVALLVGSPPDVHIPLAGRTGLEEELTRWRLTVRNKWPADPEVQVTTTLADLSPVLAISEGHVRLPLRLSTLLGEAPLGNYLVRLRGPLGRDAEFTLRLVPHLQVTGHEPLYLPDAQDGPPPVNLWVETAPGDGLECQDAADECHVQLIERREDGWRYEIAAAPGATRVELTVVRPRPSGDTVRVPVTVPMRRLRWALAGEQMGASRREWTGHVLKRPVDALLQTQSPCLLVALPLATPVEAEAHPLKLELRLLDMDSSVLQVAEAAALPRSQQSWRFDLSAFLDTIRASRSPVLRFELGVRNLPGQDEPLCLLVLSLTRTLVVQDVELVARRVGSREVFELSWREAEQLRNRCVRFWPLWRPWDPCFEQPIPDEAEGKLVFDAPPNGLRSGKYRIEFFVVDPWVSSVAFQRPSRDAPSTADVELISPERQLQYLNAKIQEQGQLKPTRPGRQRLEYVETKLQEKKQRFELLLERAVLCQDIGDPQEAEADRQWCYEHLDDGTIPQILALVELARAAEAPTMLRALQLKMFAAFRVERLLLTRSQGEISSEHFQDYLSNLPRSGLLPEATCKQLLTVEDERVRLHALQQLIHRGAVLAVDIVLEWVNAATLSDADAIALLSLNINFAVECLREWTDRPAASREHRRTARRLLDALSQTVEDAIHVGDWVHCDLGWGRIERIEKLDTGAPVRWCAGKQSPHKLTVALHPAVEPETIIIDLPSASVDFLNSGMVMICCECDMFSTQHHTLMGRHFEVAHPPRTKKEAKQRGEGYIKFRRENETSIPLSSLEFTSERPPDQWL